jgi:hypothetical protein
VIPFFPLLCCFQQCGDSGTVRGEFLVLPQCRGWVEFFAVLGSD